MLDFPRNESRHSRYHPKSSLEPWSVRENDGEETVTPIFLTILLTHVSGPRLSNVPLGDPGLESGSSPSGVFHDSS